MEKKKEETKFIPFIEGKDTSKKKKKRATKLYFLLGAGLLLGWLSWLTIEIHVSPNLGMGVVEEEIGQQQIMEQIFDEKILKLEKLLHGLSTYKGLQNVTELDRRRRNPAAVALPLTTMVEGGKQLVGAMNIIKNLFLANMEANLKALEEKIHDINNRIDDLTQEQKDKIPEALTLLYNTQEDLILTRHSLVVLAEDTMKKVNNLIRIIGKIGPKTKKVGNVVKFMLKRFNTLLTKSRDALEIAKNEYKIMSKNLNEIKAKLSYFGRTINDQAEAKERDMDRWIAATRKSVYGGCYATVILGSWVWLCYALAAPILETKISEYRSSIAELKKMAKEGSNEALSLANLSDANVKYIRHEIAILLEWKGDVDHVYHEFDEVFNDEDFELLDYIELIGKEETIEMLCDLSSVSKTYMLHKYEYGGTNILNIKIPEQHPDCIKSNCPQSKSTSVHRAKHINELKLSNIAIFGSLGDSLSAAAQYDDDVNEDTDTDGPKHFKENKLVSFTSGASPNVFRQTSLYNMLMMFNPTLIGGSTKANKPGNHGPAAGLNFATLGATIKDSDSQAKKLVTKIKDIPGWENSWKLVTFQFGLHEVCSAPDFVEWGSGLAAALTTLKDQLPNTVVLLLLPFNVNSILRPECSLAKSKDCQWITATNKCQDQVQDNIQSMEYILQDVANRFRTSTFGIEIMPALKNFTVDTDISDDCLHPDDHHNSKIGKNLWNNLLVAADRRTSYYGTDLKAACPEDPDAFLPLTRPSSKVQTTSIDEKNVDTLFIKNNNQASKDYIKVEFKNTKGNECRTKELNPNGEFKKKTLHKYKLDIFDNLSDGKCLFKPGDKVYYRIKTKKQSGSIGYDKICLNSIELKMPKVSFLSKQEICAEGTSEWQETKESKNKCG